MAEINFNGRVNKQNVDSLITAVDDFINHGELNIIVNFNTIGGDVQEGARGYDKLSIHSNKLTMNNLGNTDSSGVLLFCSGNNRTCNHNAGFLIHSAFNPTFNTQTATRQQILANERNIAMINAVQACLINATTGINIKTILSWIYALPNGRQLTPQDAHTHHLVQTINTIPIVPSLNSITIP